MTTVKHFFNIKGEELNTVESNRNHFQSRKNQYLSLRYTEKAF